MSTNYYVIKNKCKCCGRYDEYHIGKTTSGYTFLFHGYKDLNVVDIYSWKEFIKDGEIVNEYNDPITYDEMLKIIDKNKFLDHRTNEYSEEYKDGYVGDGLETDINGNDFLFCDFC